MAITIIFAPPRTGKTALMTKLLTDLAFDNERIRACKKEIETLNNGGFNYSYPGYITACNYELEMHKYGYSPRQAKRINPYRIGFFNNDVKTHFLPPYCVIGIMEGQKYFNSRMFKKFPDWQSRFYEMHGHNYYDIFIDTQRPNLIDINIRELSNFIDVLKMEIRKDKIVWTVNRIGSSFELDKYFDSGKKDYFTKDKIVGDSHILDFYNTRESKPLFYAQRFERNYDKLQEKPQGSLKERFKLYVDKYGTELPDGYYKE